MGWHVIHCLLTTGNFEVGVHIADVSYFVEEDNALDAVASQRATSVYMVQKVRAPGLYHIVSYLKILVDLSISF